MPKYSVEIPNLGKFKVESDKELTDSEVYEYALFQAKKDSINESIYTPKESERKTKQQLLDEYMTMPEVPKMGVGRAGDIGRQLGLAARIGITGAASIPAILSEPIAAMTGQPSQAGQLQKLMTQLGIPEASTPQERVVQDIGSALAGIAGPAAISRALPAAAQKFFTENLGTQAAAAGAGALASGAAREGDVGPMGQTLAGIVGSIAGGSPAATGPAIVRGAKEVVRPFTQAGREVITGNVLRSLATDAEKAIAAGEAYRPAISGYTPTTAQATRDIGLIGAETAVRGLDMTGKFGRQIGEANQARMAILDRLAQDENTLQSAIKKRDAVTGPMREQAFAQATVDPETFQSAVTLTVNKTIDDILTSPAGKRSTVQSVMDDARKDIARATTPQELYEIRKDLRAASQGLLDKSGKGGPNSGAYKVAKNELEQVIRSVDDAIDSAAPGYKDYLKKYSTSSKGIERLEAAQEFRGKVLSTTPDPSNVGDFLISQPSFTRAIRAAEKDTNLSKTQLAVLKKVGEDLDSGVLARGVKVPGSDTFKNMSTANVIGGIIGKQMYGDVPPAFAKMMAPMNWLYNGTDDAIRELIVDAMLDPKLASQFMRKASVMTVEPLSKELQKKAIALGYGATFGLTE
jgi:hypothetical protein